MQVYQRSWPSRRSRAWAEPTANSTQWGLGQESTPLDGPVVPEVYMMVQVSVGSGSSTSVGSGGDAFGVSASQVSDSGAAERPAGAAIAPA